MKYELYAIEAALGEGGPELVMRADEHGLGSPLVWVNKAGAEKYIEDVEEECGGPGGLTVVMLAGETETGNALAGHLGLPYAVWRGPQQG